MSQAARLDEISDGVFRISIPLRDIPGGFSFNQFLLKSEEPLLFHTGPKHMHKTVQEAIARVIDITSLRYIAFSHFESDECGSLNEFLRVAPNALPVCGQINAMINGDCFDRPARVMANGDTIALGNHRVRWFDTPHLPHAWECGYLMEETTGTLLCGDLFTQGGSDVEPLTRSDILDSSETFRKQLDYFSHARNTRALIAPLVAARPTTLACMHGSAWRGDGAAALTALADSLMR